jgi:hypothetical protein
MYFNTTTTAVNLVTNRPLLTPKQLQHTVPYNTISQNKRIDFNDRHGGQVVILLGVLGYLHRNEVVYSYLM